MTKTDSITTCNTQSRVCWRRIAHRPAYLGRWDTLCQKRQFWCEKMPFLAVGNVCLLKSGFLFGPKLPFLTQGVPSPQIGRTMRNPAPANTGLSVAGGN